MNATRHNKSRKAKAQTLVRCEDCCSNPQCCEGHEPPSEIIITRDWYTHTWRAQIGSHGYAIFNENGREFPSNTDPMIVSKALKAKANGPINVVWNIR